LISSLPAAADAYTFKSIPGKLIIAASKRTNPTTDTFINVNQVFYVFADPPNGTFRLLGQFDINSTLPSSDSTDSNRFIIPFLTSRNLGKLAVIFNPLSDGSAQPRTILIRSIDWKKGAISNITFADQARFDKTNARLKADNYDVMVGENFFVIRN
jgi:hypothetical protein